MKQFLLILIIVLPYLLFGQNNIPLLNQNSAQSLNLIKKINSSTEFLMITDSIRQRAKFDSVKSDIATLQQQAENKNPNPVISFYGAASIAAGTDFLSTLTSSGQLNAIINPVSNFYMGLGANLLFANPGNSVKKDSVDMNSLMFPETGRFGVLASFFNKFPLGSTTTNGEIRNHYLVPQLSFAYRRVLIDSPFVNFKVLNYNIGFKYELDALTKDNDNISLTLMPYFNFFNIPDEDVKNFDQLINDTLFTNANKHAEIKAYGVKTTLQYKSFLFFFDIRRNMKTNQLSDDDPFKGTRVNVGFSTIFNISLNKK